MRIKPSNTIFLIMLAACTALCALVCGCNTETRADIGHYDTSALYGAPLDGAGEQHEASVFFVNVGKADCAIVSVDSHTWLIDTGTEESFINVYAALEIMGVDSLDGVLLSHEHSDHMGGLGAIAKRCPVGVVIFPEFVTDRAAVDSAVYESALTSRTVRAGDTIPVSGDVCFEVLAPEKQLPGDGNDNSLVVRLRVNGRVFLFTGDMELSEEALLIEAGADVKCDVLKVANHGNKDATGEAFAKAASPLIAVYSTDRGVDGNSANSIVTVRLGRAEFYLTQKHELGIFMEISKRGEISLSFPERPAALSGVAITDVSKEKQTFTLKNTSGERVDLSGWFVYSTKGCEVFNFPAGTVMLPDEELTVACRNSAEADRASLIWDEKKAWADKKDDDAVLCDPFGNEISRAASK